MFRKSGNRFSDWNMRQKPPMNGRKASVTEVSVMKLNPAHRHRRAERAVRLAALLCLASLAGGCAAIERLRAIGDPPPLTAINNPTAAPGYKPVQMPMPAPQPAIFQPNSLWRTGSRAFFKDQRAHQVGDILTVKVKITDKATLENDTQRSRKNSEDSGVTDFIGSKLIKSPATAILPG